MKIWIDLTNSPHVNFFARIIEELQAEVDKVIGQHERGYNRERHVFLLLAVFYWIEDVLDYRGPFSHAQSDADQQWARI